MRFSHYKQSIAYSGRRDRRSVPPDFGNTSLFAEVVAGRIGDLAKKPCLTTYEAPWGAVAAFGNRVVVGGSQLYGGGAGFARVFLSLIHI